MGNYISYPFLSKLCVGREGETEKKNENKIYCRHFSAECLPTKLPLPDFVILKTVYDISYKQGFKCGGFSSSRK